MARVRKKAVDVVLTPEQLDRARTVFKEARITLRVPEYHQNTFEMYEVFNKGKKYYLEGDDEELDEIELQEMFSAEHRKSVTDSVDFFWDINSLAPIWKSLSKYTKERLLDDIVIFAINCGADENKVREGISDFEFKDLQHGQLSVPRRPRGKPFEYPGQFEATVCLLEFWISAGNDFRLGRIRYEDDSLTPSPMVRFVSRYLIEIDPSFSKQQSDAPVEDKCLERAHRILSALKEAGKIPPKAK